MHKPKVKPKVKSKNQEQVLSSRINHLKVYIYVGKLRGVSRGEQQPAAIEDRVEEPFEEPVAGTPEQDQSSHQAELRKATTDAVEGRVVGRVVGRVEELVAGTPEQYQSLYQEQSRKGNPRKSTTSARLDMRQDSVSHSSRQEPQWKDKEREWILQYIENQKNFVDLFGHKNKIPVGPKVVKVREAWERLSQLFNEANGFAHNGDSMRQRFRTYQNRFKEAFRFGSKTGEGLTEEDFKRGILTIEAKKEEMCYGYQRMVALFGNNPPINPPCVADTSRRGVHFHFKDQVVGESSNRTSRSNEMINSLYEDDESEAL
ncbi:hypothetical protein BGZ65_009235, partial [Modicella reniformis]